MQCLKYALSFAVLVVAADGGWAASIDVAQPDLPSPRLSRWMDRILAAQWPAAGVQPVGLVDEEAFCRRVTLDIIGRIPTVAERRHFLMDRDPERRARLIQRLVNSDEFATYWASLWTGWLLTRGAAPTHQDQLRGWLEQEFRHKTSHKDLVTKLLTAQGKASENGAVTFLALGRGEPVPAKQRQAEGHYEFAPGTARIARLFLGIDARCIQCHDHPFDPNWKQKQFWALTGFFRQVEVEDARPKAAQGRGTPDWLVIDNPTLNQAGLIFWANRRAVVLAVRPTYLDGKKANLQAPLGRRPQLADFVTSDPQFARAAVNRMWGQFFGRGLNEHPAVDDFGIHNQVVHEELLDRLAREFVNARFDPRLLITWICNTEAYHRQCAPNGTNVDSEKDTSFSRMLPKPMNAEQLFASALVAERGTARIPRAERDRLWRRWAAAFAADAAEAGAVASCADQDHTEPSMSTLMRLLNDPTFTGGKQDDVERFTRLYDADRVADEIYVAVMHRHARLEEQKALAREIELQHQSGGEDLKPFWQDLFWALRNSNEFFFNH